MKKNLLMLLVALTGTFMASFSYAQGTAEKAAGIYKGQLQVSLDGVEVGNPMEENVYITVVENNRITLEIKNFSFGFGSTSIPIGDIIIKEIEIVEENNIIKLMSKDVQLTLPEPIGLVNVHLPEGSTIQDQKIDLNLTVETIYPQELLVGVQFKGTKNGESIRSLQTNKFSLSVLKDNLFVQGTEANAVFAIYSITGSLVKTGKLNESSISLGEFEKGLYLIKIGENTVKFIKR